MKFESDLYRMCVYFFIFMYPYLQSIFLDNTYIGAKSVMLILENLGGEGKKYF